MGVCQTGEHYPSVVFEICLKMYTTQKCKRKIVKTPKPSKLQRARDEQTITNMIFENDFAEYQESFNPFEKNTLRSERFERLYRRKRKSMMDTDRQFKHLCEVYGTPY